MRPMPRSWRWPPRRCSISAAGPAAISPRCRRAAGSRSASTSPPLPYGSLAVGAPRRSPATCSGRCRGAAAGRRRCCWTATSGSAARPRRPAPPRAGRSGAGAAPPHARAAGARRHRPRRARSAGRAHVTHAHPHRGRRRRERLVPLGARRGRRHRAAGRPRGAAGGGRAVRRRSLAGAAAGTMTPRLFRSPLRGPWLTSALGSILLVLVAVVAITGFLSHAAYEPDLRGNAIVPVGRDLPLTFGWPTRPAWLYAVNQSLHVNAGLVAVPFLLAKLWSVLPRLFVWPPVTSAANAIERLAIALLVSSAIFQFATGIVNAQYWYAFHFNFVVAHYYGAVV